ncbi:DUF6578 domain-containing protein [Streptomyces sp. NPDC017993]|uniref:DUF6578 domain-containing protein n=1 Tax=Streptomyces sp. NPDC017993 TaxID=3365027 RepID=UPI00379D5322
MTLAIWVDAWQIQCRGKSFTPGDVVSWKLLEADPEDYADVVGSERAAEIEFREEHHGQEEHAPTWLQVLTIAEVYCRYVAPQAAPPTCNTRCGAPPNWFRSRKPTGGQRLGLMSPLRGTWLPPGVPQTCQAEREPRGIGDVPSSASTFLRPLPRRSDV